MTRDEVASRITDLIRDRSVVEVEIIREDMKLVEDLGFDSLDRIELGIVIEDEFGIEVEDSVLKEIATVRDVINMVLR